MRTSIKTLVSRKTTILRLKKSQSNDKLFRKINVFHSSPGIKTFIEVSYIYNIHAGEEVFSSCFFGRFVSRFDPDKVKQFEVNFGLYESSLLL